MSRERTIAVWNALAQWADNERSRDDVDDAYAANPDLVHVEEVVAELETAILGALGALP